MKMNVLLYELYISVLINGFKVTGLSRQKCIQLRVHVITVTVLHVIALRTRIDCEARCVRNVVSQYLSSRETRKEMRSTTRAARRHETCTQ